MNRREFVAAGVVAGMTGCLGGEGETASRDETPRLLTEEETPESGTEEETPEPGVEPLSSYGSYDGRPYDGIDWDTYGRHKGQFHIHPHYGNLGPPQEVYDRYVELGYDILCIQPKDDLRHGMPWPLEEIGDALNRWESRYPAEDGVVAIPGAEYTDTPHVSGFFTDLMQEELKEELGSGSMDNPAHQYDTVERIVRSESTPETVSPLAFIGHPGRYKEEMSEDEWETEWLRNYHEMIGDFDRLLGLEAITYSFAYDDRETWDRLLSEAAPDRPVMGTSVDDIGEYEDADRGWVTFYLSPEEFTPADQHATRERVYQAWVSGRTSFSTTKEPGTGAPIIEEIERDEDAGTISLRASGHDVIEWVSDGEVIETGETIEYRDNTDAGPYIRAQIIEGDPPDPDSITCTQAWY